ncbi:fructosamine kinase family protein [Marinobacter salinisoli]|uniref:Fructosamine kinase family protein n=1 Tax=Marinobacter salinisoli TaxID=2769486 RepID=A0ABX7MP86_9GAMM|nr:fructosamine kinase family protein [Marinobacter salinisoli]QSP93998.1 fructosamine kinase family protein [Marinobacter salinisoli]
MAGRHLKANTSGYSDALMCEAEGLESLRSALQLAGVSALRIPEVFSVSHRELAMTAIGSRPAREESLRLLGEGLARLHHIKQTRYGWHRDNYIGLAPQPNGWHQTWGTFFVHQRLSFQVGRIRNSTLRQRFSESLDRYGVELAAWFDTHCAQPSLLHGDLWNGNVLFDDDGPWLIDPAVYCGDREADLAMTEMFSGFGAAFYQAYDRINPRTEVYPRKRDIYNLYHYLNHYNLFGAGYLSGCERGFAVIERIAG